MKSAIRYSTLAVFGLALLSSAALAQSPPGDTAPAASQKGEATDHRACGPSGTHATVGQGGDVVVRKPDDQTLSSKLADSGGVICPPQAVDPEIKAPTPEAGRMPVIPPPGAPGGDPTVKPQ